MPPLDPYRLSRPGDDPHSHALPPKLPPPGDPSRFLENLDPEYARLKRVNAKQRQLFELEQAAKKRQARESLDKEIEWDGSDVTPKTLIKKLNSIQKLWIRADDKDGETMELDIAPEDAYLLPPGRYSLKTLLKVLAEISGLEWELNQYNQIVFRPRSPRPELPFEGTGNLIPGKTDKEALQELRGKTAKFIEMMSPDEKKRLFEELVAEQRRKASSDEETQ